MNMKPVLLLMACVAGLFAGAQMKEGRVVYERTVQIQLPNFRNLDPEMAQRIPRSRTDQFELLFSDNKTLWQYLPSESATRKLRSNISLLSTRLRLSRSV